MKEDMTYNEIDSCKSEIKAFLTNIHNMREYDLTIETYDDEFFTVISKHIMFFKYLYLGNNHVFYFRILISDFYYFIISILKMEVRYMYLNERSVIENYTRLITNISVNNDHVTENSFKILKTKSDSRNFDVNNYALLKNEYATSCGYVHGSDIIEKNLSFVFNECINNHCSIEERTKYYERIKKLLRYLDNLLIYEYSEFISGCFHRKKALLEYLLGSKCLETLFNELNR